MKKLRDKCALVRWKEINAITTYLRYTILVLLAPLDGEPRAGSEPESFISDYQQRAFPNSTIEHRLGNEVLCLPI